MVSYLLNLQVALCRKTCPVLPFLARSREMEGRRKKVCLVFLSSSRKNPNIPALKTKTESLKKQFKHCGQMFGKINNVHMVTGEN